MNFSDNYFKRFKTSPPFSEDIPDDNLGIVVIIPCYDDEHIFTTLSSLEKAKSPNCKVEVIVVINSSENTSPAIINKNRDIYKGLKELQTLYTKFSIFPIILENIPQKTAGVGNARKVGMDEAVHRFSHINKPTGIISSLDADALVSEDYFIVMEKAFQTHPSKGVSVFQFKHNFDYKIYSSAEIEACKLYEIYLRYFRISLDLTGFPYAIHTIGSCFAVNALTYIKVGGMPRKQAGEDFYFLHKAALATEINNINQTLVFPSPRCSDRVPFGTGPAVNKIIMDKTYFVYNFRLFFVLKSFFDELKSFSFSGYLNEDHIPNEIKDFLGKEKILHAINECAQNSTKGKRLLKRLFSKFDAFFIIKFLNSFNENSQYPPQYILEAVKSLLIHSGSAYEELTVYDDLIKLDRAI